MLHTSVLLQLAAGTPPILQSERIRCTQRDNLHGIPKRHSPRHASACILSALPGSLLFNLASAT